MFEDEVTIDSLTRGQLQALCRVLSIIPIGTDQMLRFQLDIKLRRLLVDDKVSIFTLKFASFVVFQDIREVETKAVQKAICHKKKDLLKIEKTNTKQKLIYVD